MPCIESEVNDIDLIDDPAWQTWSLCRSVFKSHNYLLRFPKNTDPRKTYQWRYVTKLTSKFDEWGFDRPTAKVFLEAAVKELGPVNIRKNGLACLFSNGLLELVYKRLTSREDDINKTIEGIRSSNDFLMSKLSNGHKLLGMSGNNYNITSWYMADRITAGYLAISKSCSNAVSAVRELDPVQADAFPSKSELHTKRRQIITQYESIASIRHLLGEDWKSC